MAYDVRTVKKSEDGTPFDFTIDGEQFTFPPIMATDWHVSSRIAEGNFAAAVQLLLGETDFARFDKLTLSIDELNGLFDAYAESGDTTVGESKASTGS